MNVVRQLVFSSCLVINLVAVSLLPSTASACTGIVLKAQNGDAVYGRTQEWGAFDLNSRLVVVPRGTAFKGHTPDGKPGYQWKSKYGMVALDAIEQDYVMDGMNEKGLVVGVFYLPGFTEFQPYDPEQANVSMSSLEMANYVLTQFATVDEVREGMEKVRVVPVPEAALGGIPAPVHLMVVDPSGKTIVIEYIKGSLTVFDNPLRVITNSPNFDWHMTNLRNHINLSAVALPTKTIEDLDFSPLGAGTGLMGLPGDFTPPSRFVRAVAFSQMARKTPDADETVYEALRIMDNFNLPLGSAEGPDADPEKLRGMRSSTLWTVAADTKNLKYYYHTQHNRQLRMVDLTRIDFSPSREGVKRFPLDRHKSQSIEDVTP